MLASPTIALDSIKGKIVSFTKFVMFISIIYLRSNNNLPDSLKGRREVYIQIYMKGKRKITCISTFIHLTFINIMYTNQ